MTDDTVTDLRRELAKALSALDGVLTYLTRHAEMNAALHCADRVLHSPLHARVEAAVYQIHHALDRTDPGGLGASAILAATDADTAWDVLAAVIAPQHFTLTIADQPPLRGTWHGGGMGKQRAGGLAVEPVLSFPPTIPADETSD